METNVNFASKGLKEKEVMKFKFFAIILLLISNCIFAALYFTKGNDNQYLFLLQLEGESENWKMEDYLVKLSNTEIYEGSGKLTYIGEGNVSDYAIFFYMDDKPLSSTSMPYKGPVILGGGGSTSVSNELVFPIESAKSIYAKITFDGKTEIIELSSPALQL